jgi:NADH-quinone oxidoreductase subunit L
MSIIKWSIISIIMNWSGSIIGINGSIYIILCVLIISPIISWYILYNYVIISKNSQIYVITYNLINYYYYTLNISITISIMLMIVVILLINVSYIICIYILYYMYKDKNIVRFISVIMLFTFNMIILIISNDVVLLFIGWEMIGIISLLLISYYSNRIEASRAGLKAIFYNRVGDITLLLFVVLSINVYSSNNITIYSILITYNNYNINNINIIIGVLLIISAWSKSAQLGFQPWLLDAMEGPTPVSALLHSATLVTAGAIILYKNIYIINNSISILIIILGGISCIYNCISSIYYLDIKRIVAYSTCTHISLIIMVIGIDIIYESRSVSILHLFYHGWTKSLIFMICGYLISLIHSQDIRYYGSLYMSIPLVFVVINISLLNILGFIGTYLSYSKDLILELGLISIYGYNIVLVFVLILLLSSGYSLGILLYLIYSYSYYNVVSYTYNNSYIILFIYLIIVIIYLPTLLYDILVYKNISVMHSISIIDPFSIIIIIGMLLSYYNYTYNNSIYIMNIHNNRLYMDKIISSIITNISSSIIYRIIFVLEYGFVMHYIFIVNIILFVLLLV